jgi:hypothetical protein
MKRQRELAQKKKRADKLQRRLDKKNPQGAEESPAQQDAGLQPAQQ